MKFKNSNKLLMILTTLLVCVFISGCKFNTSMVDTPEPEEKFDAVYLPVNIMGKIIAATQIEYVPDAKGKDFWQTPKETLTRKKGDCEDIAILLQHELSKLDLRVEVVFGLKTIWQKHGHAWCEFSYQGVDYIIEPANGVCYKRKYLPREIYYPAKRVSTVAKKIKAYHYKTGVWVNSEYKQWIENASAKYE